MREGGLLELLRYCTESLFVSRLMFVSATSLLVLCMYNFIVFKYFLFTIII